MKNALVIVDAWFLDDWPKSLTEKFGKSPVPNWPQEVKENIKHFGNFLSYVCDTERKKGTTIIHSLGSVTNKFLEFANENASAVKVKEGDIITASDAIGRAIAASKANKVFWGGFHFGKCIHTHSNRAYQYLNSIGRHDINLLNLVLNLSMILPKHSWNHHIIGKKAWGVNLHKDDVREAYENSAFKDKEFLPGHFHDPSISVNYVFNPVKYTHSLWSTNSFEDLALKDTF